MYIQEVDLFNETNFNQLFETELFEFKYDSFASTNKKNDVTSIQVIIDFKDKIINKKYQENIIIFGNREFVELVSAISSGGDMDLIGYQKIANIANTEYQSMQNDNTLKSTEKNINELYKRLKKENVDRIIFTWISFMFHTFDKMIKEYGSSIVHACIQFREIINNQNTIPTLFEYLLKKLCNMIIHTHYNYTIPIDKSTLIDEW